MISVFQTYVVVVVNLEDWALPKIFLFEAPILTISKELSFKKCRLGVSIHCQFVVRIPDLNNWDRWAESD